DGITRGKLVEEDMDADIFEQVKGLQDVLLIYEGMYLNEKGLYYDIKCRPLAHARTFFLLAKFLQHKQLKSFQCFPIRTQWVPCHVHIDKKILSQWFLQVRTDNGKYTNKLWDDVIDTNCRAVKSILGGKKFSGSIETDGVLICIFKKCKRRKKSETSEPSIKNECRYIESVEQDELSTMDNNCVLIDPGRRDLLFCMHELSTVANPWTFSEKSGFY
ncbi:hypothetical protein LPJ59_001296, partial [Coemansia sp. RSA 2399]